MLLRPCALLRVANAEFPCQRRSDATGQNKSSTEARVLNRFRMSQQLLSWHVKCTKPRRDNGLAGSGAGGETWRARLKSLLDKDIVFLA